MQSIRTLFCCCFFVAIFIPVVSNAFTENQVPPTATLSDLPQKFDPKRDAMADLKTAIALAQNEHKHILVDIGGDWCAGCIELEKFFDDHLGIKAARDKNFIYLRINYSSENENKKFINQFSWFIGYPHWFVLDETGKQLHSSFVTDSGADFMKFVKEWSAPQK